MGFSPPTFDCGLSAFESELHRQAEDQGEQQGDGRIGPREVDAFAGCGDEQDQDVDGEHEQQTVLDEDASSTGGNAQRGQDVCAGQEGTCEKDHNVQDELQNYRENTLHRASLLAAKRIIAAARFSLAQRGGLGASGSTPQRR